jgi:hypothetical protein
MKKLIADARRQACSEYPASEKLEIIQLVEQSHLPVRRKSGHGQSTLMTQLGLPPLARNLS